MPAPSAGMPPCEFPCVTAHPAPAKGRSGRGRGDWCRLLGLGRARRLADAPAGPTLAALLPPVVQQPIVGRAVRHFLRRGWQIVAKRQPPHPISSGHGRSPFSQLARFLLVSILTQPPDRVRRSIRLCHLLSSVTSRA